MAVSLWHWGLYNRMWRLYYNSLYVGLATNKQHRRFTTYSLTLMGLKCKKYSVTTRYNQIIAWIASGSTSVENEQIILVYKWKVWHCVRATHQVCILLSVFYVYGMLFYPELFVLFLFLFLLRRQSLVKISELLVRNQAEISTSSKKKGEWEVYLIIPPWKLSSFCLLSQLKLQIQS